MLHLGESFCPPKNFQPDQSSPFLTFLDQRLDAVWRDARWIMDCLQCVRSKQWVGAVPLGLVMGGDPPPCPDPEEENERLTARLTWPFRLQSKRATAGNKKKCGHVYCALQVSTKDVLYFYYLCIMTAYLIQSLQWTCVVVKTLWLIDL